MNYTILNNFSTKFLKMAEINLKETLEQLSSLRSFAARNRFCKENFTRVGQGSGRVVYILPDGSALKLAKNPKGIAQNSLESEYLLNQSDAVNKTINSDFNNLWLICPLAKKLTPSRFKELTGMNFKEFADVICYLGNIPKSNKNIELPINFDKIRENPLTEAIEYNLIGDYDMPVGDLMRLNSYGEVNGKVVVIDFGLSKEIYEEYY